MQIVVHKVSICLQLIGSHAHASHPLSSGRSIVFTCAPREAPISKARINMAGLSEGIVSGEIQKAKYDEERKEASQSL